jgi:hypothetical protein
MAHLVQSIKLNLEQSNLLQSIIRRREVPHRLGQRAKSILKPLKNIVVSSTLLSNCKYLYQR